MQAASPVFRWIIFSALITVSLLFQLQVRCICAEAAEPANAETNLILEKSDGQADSGASSGSTSSSAQSASADSMKSTASTGQNASGASAESTASSVQNTSGASAENTASPGQNASETSAKNASAQGQYSSKVSSEGTSKTERPPQGTSSVYDGSKIQTGDLSEPEFWAAVLGLSAGIISAAAKKKVKLPHKI